MSLRAFAKLITASKNRPFIPGACCPVRWDLDLSGTRLRFDCPHHSDPEWSRESDIGWPEDSRSRSVNIYERSKMVSEGEQGTYRSLNVLASGIAIKGQPFISGKLGSVRFVLNVDTFNTEAMALNIFNPSHFEFAILTNLYFTRGPGNGSRRSKAPIGWHIRRSGGLEFICYDVERQKTSDTRKAHLSGETFCHLPISDQHFITFSFFRSCTPYTINCDKAIREVIDRILRSVRLDLSPSSAAKLTEAKHRWPDAQYSSHRNPEPWIFEERKLPDWDMDEYPTEILDEHYIVTRQASPPPVYEE